MNKKEKKIIKIFAIIFAIVFIISLVVFFNKDNIVRKEKFIKPVMDETATVGTPKDIPNDLNYKEMSIKDDYVVYLCATPKVDGNTLTLYFTSSEKNKDLLKIRIFDKDENILAESGLINPNSYIEYLELNRELKDNEMISIKVMAYEKDTFYSNGGFKLNIYVESE